MGHELFFTGEYALGNDVQFIAYDGNHRIVNRVTADALRDFFSAEATPGALRKTYDWHAGEFTRLARARIEHEELNELGGADITTGYLREIQYKVPAGTRSSRFDIHLGFRAVEQRITAIMCPMHYRHISVEGFADDVVTYRGCCETILDTVSRYLSAVTREKTATDR